jgi:hypothetical protein
MLLVRLYDNWVYLGFDSFIRGEWNRYDAGSMRSRRFRMWRFRSV